jgi:hypothetical protein
VGQSSSWLFSYKLPFELCFGEGEGGEEMMEGVRGLVEAQGGKGVLQLGEEACFGCEMGEEK